MKLRALLPFARLALLGGILSVLVIRIVDSWPDVATLRFGASPGPLVGAFLCSLVAYACLPLAWIVLVRGAGAYDRARLRTYVRAWWLSYLHRYVPGRVLLVAERVRLGAQLGIPVATGVELAFIETVVTLAAAAWISTLALSLLDLPPWVFPTGALLLTLSSVGIVLMIGRLARAWPALRRRYPDLGSHRVRPVTLFVALLLHVGHYLLQGLSLFWLVRSVAPVPADAWSGITGAYALAHLVGLVTVIAPAGLGVREGVLAAQLLRLVPAGIAEAVAVGSRIWFTLTELVAFALVMISCPPEAPRGRTR